MQNHVIKINNLSIKYYDSEKYALNNIDLDISEGEIVCVMGAAGAGKTTLLLTLNGIIPNSVKVFMDGNVVVNGLDTREYGVKDFAKTVGVVFQDPDNQLFCASVEEEVGYALSNHELPREVIKERVREALYNVRLEGYEDRIPQSLSGGEKQRVAIASALSLYPKLLVLDEPTSQLDPMGTQEVFEVIQRLRKDKKITVVLAEHKSEEIAEIVDRIFVLRNGQKLFEGHPEDIFCREELTSIYGIRAPQVSEAVNLLKNRADIHSESFNKVPIKYREALSFFKVLCG